MLRAAQALQEIEDNLREEQRIACEEQLIAFKQARPYARLHPDPHDHDGCQVLMLALNVKHCLSNTDGLSRKLIACLAWQ